MSEGPSHCGLRMTIVPGYAVHRYMCENCGAIAIATKLGYKIYPIDKLHLIGKPAKEDR